MKGKMGLWLATACGIALLCMLLASGQKAQTASQEERRIAEVLSAINGAGKVEVALFYGAENTFGENGLPTGAVVVAQGAGDLSVRLNLIRALRTLLGLPENAVDVFMMEGEGI